MASAPPLPSIGRCSAASRSSLLGPDGPAGAPPGHRLRSGGYMAAIRSGTKGNISPTDVSTLSGEPRLSDRRSCCGYAVSLDCRRTGLHMRALLALGALKIAAAVAACTSVATGTDTGQNTKIGRA